MIHMRERPNEKALEVDGRLAEEEGEGRVGDFLSRAARATPPFPLEKKEREIEETIGARDATAA